MRERVLMTSGIPEANGYEFVDLGLPSGLLWATCNIGADKPSDYGLYFAWGETTGYTNASAKSGGFAMETTPYLAATGESVSDIKWFKYTTNNISSSNGKADNKLVLEQEDDAAHVIMGGAWRMPTSVEFQELYDSCNTSWVTSYNGNNVNGILFTLKTDSSKQLFFPATGYAIDASIRSVNSTGVYWSSSLSTSANYIAYNLYISKTNVNPQNSYSRSYGFPIRGVLQLNK